VHEGIEILQALRRIGSPETIPFLEEILMAPAFDAYEVRQWRSMAAWAALEIGGEQMSSTLRRSAERREGRDVDVLVYLAVLAGADALPTIRKYLIPRLGYLEWERGLEHERLGWIIRQLSEGDSIASLDRPPIEIALGRWD